ncbi:hypothetical protein LSM04_007959 [Trypanosoma melophagium]|uniref:uncharacterized protein n=1 Tax=Trypanosoma melophagium TaxID=715481 RepID=UPI00351A0406|nr:hypothetical protein LSM04_007959 [Trypanosoma melophagium]
MEEQDATDAPAPLKLAARPTGNAGRSPAVPQPRLGDTGICVSVVQGRSRYVVDDTQQHGADCWCPAGSPPLHKRGGGYQPKQRRGMAVGGGLRASVQADTAHQGADTTLRRELLQSEGDALATKSLLPAGGTFPRPYVELRGPSGRYHYPTEARCKAISAAADQRRRRQQQQQQKKQESATAAARGVERRGAPQRYPVLVWMARGKAAHPVQAPEQNQEEGVSALHKRRFQHGAQDVVQRTQAHRSDNGTAVSAQGRDKVLRQAGHDNGGAAAHDGPHPGLDAQHLSRTWPADNYGRRAKTGQRRGAPPLVSAKYLGVKAPKAADLGICDRDVYRLMLDLKRQQQAPDASDVAVDVAGDNVKEWRLHLKHTTPLDTEAVRQMATAHPHTKAFLEEAYRYITVDASPDPYPMPHLVQTSRTIKTTKMTKEDLQKAVSMGKFELCRDEHGPPIAHFDSRTGMIPTGYYGVNVFTVPEMKGRRRLITEPHLNAVMAKADMPQVNYPTRLGRRQSLRYAKYMLQLDFEASYDAIPLPAALRNKFVFRCGGSYYRLCTLPTGARWSVAVGQATTWVLVDIDTPVIIHTMIDNILIAAKEGQEEEFVSAVRQVLLRIRAANLLTSPDREELLQYTEEELLRLAEQNNVFLGEEYMWNGTERVVRNSVKTVAKLMLSSAPDRQHSIRTFVSVVSLVCYAIHTTRLNPAKMFRLLRTYRYFYRQVSGGADWDAPVPYIHPKVTDELSRISNELIKNQWWRIDPPRHVDYNDGSYDIVAYTDASREGWGAVVHFQFTGEVTTFQQRFVTHHQLPFYKGEPTGGDDGDNHDRLYDDAYGVEDEEEEDEENEDVFVEDPEDRALRDIRGLRASIPVHNATGPFRARHSAHAKPRAVQALLLLLHKEGTLRPGMRIAVVTDHYAIAAAQKRLNGFGGIGRGFSLNKLFETTYNLWYDYDIEVIFY